MIWAISDLHFGHKNILKMERTQFSTIEEHDQYILNSLTSWYEEKAKDNDELWVLGDFGDTDRLPDFVSCFDGVKYVKLVFLYGNHDYLEDLPKFQYHFDVVHLYPVYLSQRVVLSHEPVYPIAPFMVNVHGHLHAAKLDTPNHISVSINDINYSPLNFKILNSALGKVEQRNMKFLWEPFAEAYKFKHKKRTDVVCNPKTGKIDLAASRACQKIYRANNPQIYE